MDSEDGSGTSSKSGSETQITKSPLSKQIYDFLFLEVNRLRTSIVFAYLLLMGSLWSVLLLNEESIHLIFFVVFFLVLPTLAILFLISVTAPILIVLRRPVRRLLVNMLIAWLIIPISVIISLRLLNTPYCANEQMRYCDEFIIPHLEEYRAKNGVYPDDPYWAVPRSVEWPPNVDYNVNGNYGIMDVIDPCDPSLFAASYGYYDGEWRYIEW